MDATAFTATKDHELWDPWEEHRRMRREHLRCIEYLEHLELLCERVRCACIERRYAMLRFRSPSPQRKRKYEKSSPNKHEDPQKAEDASPTLDLEELLAESDAGSSIMPNPRATASASAT